MFKYQESQQCDSDNIKFTTVVEIDRYPLGLSIETVVNRYDMVNNCDLECSETVSLINHEDAMRLRDYLNEVYPVDTKNNE